MKHLFLIVCFMFAAVALFAHPKTTAVVTHPKTDVVPLVRPRSNAVVARPTTTSRVAQPLTPGGTTQAFMLGTKEDQPAGAAPAATPVVGTKTSAKSSYEPSYKKAKDFKSSSTAVPKQTNQNPEAKNNGLGMKDPMAAQKEADARTFDIQKALDEGTFKNIVPPEIMGKLKQRNHEAAKSAGKK
ncbi:MAG: hypothetical protein IKL48_04595 [Elusimicrobiaceae bacterium]|nr:hypothetical protein [Elusimicrobiaceae bacterium]